MALKVVDQKKTDETDGIKEENPEKPTTTDTVTGVDTAAANLYQKSFEVEFEEDDNNNSVI